ncbi:ChaN family lipoprotein [Providencia rettgeri]|nr:ChaN family lipoprotein [Providencia rettgeri]MBW3105769.1 ChaN family lipoprotein [Providencia rettgeri]
MESIMISIRLTSRIATLMVGLFFLIGCTQKIEPTNVQLDSQLTASDQIIDLATGKSLTPQQLVEQLAQSPRVIVGEKHDNHYHHQIEQWLVQEMPKIRPQGAVLLEMLTPSQQKGVSRVQAQMQSNPYIRDEKLQSAIKWNSGWPWEQYGALIRHLLSSPYPLLSANLDKEEVLSAYSNPSSIMGQYSTQPIVQELISKTIESSHGGELTAEQVVKMTFIQQLRDRRMAESLLNAPTPALLFAGGYHATRAIGVPLHVQDLAPDESVKVLIISERGEEIDHLHADFVWYTPK